MVRTTRLNSFAKWLPPKPDLLWMGVAGITLVAFLLPVSSYVASLPVIQEQWGLNNTQAGVVYSTYLAGYALSALAIIPLTDRIGSRPVLFGAGLLSIVSHVLFPIIANSPVEAALLRAVQGVGLVGVYMPALRIIAERFPKGGRGFATGFFVTAGYGGHSLSLVITGGLMNFVEWTVAYTILAAISALCIPMGYLLLRTHRTVRSALASGRLDVRVFKYRAVRFMVAGYTVHTLEIFAIQVWIPLFMAAVLIDRGFSTTAAAVAASTMAGMAFTIGAVGPLIGGMFSDRLGRARTIAAVSLIGAVCAWSLGWMGGAPWALIVLVVVVYGIAGSSDSAIYSAALIDSVPADNAGSSLAILSFVGFMGGVIGPIVFGGIVDIVPDAISWGIGFSFVAILATASSLMFLWFNMLEKRETFSRSLPQGSSPSQ